MIRTLVLIAVLSSACAPTPEPSGAPPGETVESAPSPGRGSPPGHAELLDDALRERHLEWWRSLPAGHGEMSLVSAESGSNYTELVLAERVESEAGCRRDLLFLSYWHADGETGPVESDEGRLEGDCCEGEPCERSPVGWMVHLGEALRADDREALAALVPAGGTTRIRTGWHGPESLGEDHATPTADEVRTSGLPIGGPVLRSDGVSCDEPDAEGAFSCRSFAGGFQASYDWRLSDGRAVLLSVDEESH